MPVLVTGATGTIGRALAARLVAEGGQVRAYVRRDDPRLRALGVHVALGAADDVQRLEAALTQVHTLVHLVGGYTASGTTLQWLNEETAEVAAIAARAADVRRIVYLSLPGADPSSPNRLLSSKGRAEMQIRSSGLEHVILRATPVAGEPMSRVLLSMRRGPLLIVPGSGWQRMNPVALDDVVDAIVAADERGEALCGTWDLGGPRVMTFREMAELAGVGGRSLRAPVLASGVAPLMDFFARDLVVDPAPAVRQFRLSLRPPY